MRLSDNRYEAIKQIVVRLFEDYNVCSTPISGFEIANRMGISVIPYSAFPPSKRNLFMQHSEDGCSGYDNGGWRIAYNDDQSRPYGRVNFTILHELGHIVLNHTEDSDYADKEALAEAMFFYEYAASKGDEFLEAHNYSLEEIRDGIQQLAEDAGYGNIINMLDIK